MTKDEPYLIVLEFMHLGSLSGYLKSEFVKGKLETQRLIKMSGDVCAGMFYLSSMGFVVRHVMCRLYVSIFIDIRLSFYTDASLNEC